MIPNIVTTKEACKILKIGRTSLNNILLTDPTFPAVQAGANCVSIHTPRGGRDPAI